MPVVKGGVWTNIEDEILKAAVSKYGLNQWARVSSLLARKTPKQCKARWTEWLDPSIKKIEWSRDEDEKLLHLAKLMPTQWRTIAPIVGRTANQCLERYQKLLDDAEAKEVTDLGLTGPEGPESQAAYNANGTRRVRRLRAGEVDPDPETKPARPDPVDLDEDEKEMLSEARARLANTQGKKAKRKARERQQEESRRLAALQKRRELKTAGINVKIVTRKPGQMDYNADIPFEKQPARGLYDTSEEQAINDYQKANFNPRKLQLATKRKGDEDGDGERKRRKNDKDPQSASIQAALKAGQMQRIREAEQSSKRRPLVLPSPQVTDGELEEIVKMGMAGERANQLARLSTPDATGGLVASYSVLNTNTPIRTPIAAKEDDHVANEIRNIMALTEAQSALLGGENPLLFEGKGTTGYDGIAPRKQVVSTPNPLATPLRHALGMAGAATPQRAGQTPLRTPRDPFALNRDGGGSSAAATPEAAATPRDARAMQTAIRSRIRDSFASLPKPKDEEFEFDLPEERDERDSSAATVASALPEDAAERDRRERRQKEAQEALERRRRTQVMQRVLPRPVVVDAAALTAGMPSGQLDGWALIAREVGLLVVRDATMFPLPNGRVVGQPGRLERFDDDALAEARLLMLLEAGAPPGEDEVRRLFDDRDRDGFLLGLPQLGNGIEGPDHDDEVVDRAVREAYEAQKRDIVIAAGRDAKLNKKLATRMRGYEMREEALQNRTAEAAAVTAKAQLALGGFTALAGAEEQALARRLGRLRDEVGVVHRREREAQELFRRAREELDSMQRGGGAA